MAKTVEETNEAYVASVPMAMWKTKNSLMRKRNFQEDYAITKACDYGVNMLNAGISDIITPEKAATIFRELATINRVMAELCEK